MCTRIINLQNKLEVLDFNKEMLRNVVKASSIGNKDAEILHLEDRKAKFEIILKEHYFILKEISRDNAVKLLASIEAILAKESNDYSRFYQQSLKIIDKKGFEFADEVNRRSKALQENKKFSPEQTAALVTDWGNDNKLTKNITAFNKTFGHNPFASRRKVAAARENILPISRYQIIVALHFLLFKIDLPRII